MGDSAVGRPFILGMPADDATTPEGCKLATFFVGHYPNVMLLEVPRGQDVIHRAGW